MKRMMTNGAALGAAALLMLSNMLWAQKVADERGVHEWDPTNIAPVSPDAGTPEGWLDTGSRSISPEQWHRYAEEVQDPAFDVYVSPSVLSHAYGRQDPDMLTDAALQIAEGERVLLRSRKGITAEQVLHLAVSVAIEKNATQALQRLGKAAAAMQHDKLAARIAEAETLTAATRSGDTFLIPVDALSPDQYRKLHQGLLALRAARLRGDAQAVDEIAKSLEGMPACCEPRLTQLLKEARSAVYQAPVEPHTRLFFAKLEAASRTEPTPSPPPVILEPAEPPIDVAGLAALSSPSRSGSTLSVASYATIRNATDNTLYYSVNGMAQTIGARKTSSYMLASNSGNYSPKTIRFDNGRGTQKQCQVDEGQYYFAWTTQGLDLFKDNANPATAHHVTEQRQREQQEWLRQRRAEAERRGATFLTQEEAERLWGKVPDGTVLEEVR